MKEAEIEKMRNDFEAAVLTMSLEQKMLLLDFINHLEQGRAGKREMGSCEHLGNKQVTNFPPPVRTVTLWVPSGPSSTGRNT